MFFLLGNRNQTSIAVDLKSKEGVEIIHKLLREYDVVIENFRAGVMEKLGLGYEDLKKINPGIIYCSCSGYGSSGPYVKKPGQDLLIQSMSGLVSLTGSDPEAPSPVGTPVVDQHGAGRGKAIRWRQAFWDRHWICSRKPWDIISTEDSLQSAPPPGSAPGSTSLPTACTGPGTAASPFPWFRWKS